MKPAGKVAAAVLHDLQLPANLAVRGRLEFERNDPMRNTVKLQVRSLGRAIIQSSTVHSRPTKYCFSAIFGADTQ